VILYTPSDVYWCVLLAPVAPVPVTDAVPSPKMYVYVSALAGTEVPSTGRYIIYYC
jgi:hypothetical protein